MVEALVTHPRIQKWHADLRFLKDLLPRARTQTAVDVKPAFLRATQEHCDAVHVIHGRYFAPEDIATRSIATFPAELKGIRSMTSFAASEFSEPVQLGFRLPPWHNLTQRGNEPVCPGAKQAAVGVGEGC